MNTSVMRMCLCLFVCFLTMKAVAQKPACEQLVFETFRKMKALDLADGYVHYRLTVHVTPRAGTSYSPTTASSVQVEVTMGKGRISYESNHLAIYGDNQETYIVIHPQKRIIRRTIPAGEALLTGNKQEGMGQWMLSQQETLLKKAKPLPCRDTIVDGNKQQIISFSFSREDRQKNGVNLIQYLYNLKNRHISKHTVWYTPAHPLEKVIAVYDQIETGGKVTLKKKAKDYVFVQQMLVKGLSGYRIENE
jgi:hypothetical protein